MTAFSQLVEAKIQEILNTVWQTRNGIVVPESEDVALKNGAVMLDATYVYADLANSSGAAHKLRKEVTAKIVRCYLDAASRILLHYQGHIRSFDGDRVMAIFIGTSKNTNAVRSALAINWAVEKVLRPRFLSAWPTLPEHWKLNHGVGIDTGQALLVRGGVRNNNDLISIGIAPNVAAKLSSLRGSAATYITSAVYNGMADTVKTSPDKRSMWTDYVAQAIGGTTYRVFGSSWYWKP